MTQVANLVQLLLENLNRHPTKNALYYKSQGMYVPITFHSWFESVRLFACGLSQLGVVAGEFVAILCGNRPEWTIADLGILSISAVTVPVYSTLAAPEIAYILQDSSASAIVVETQAQLDRVLEIADQCVRLRHIVLVDKYLITNDPRCVTLDSVIQMGRESSMTYEEYLVSLDQIGSDQLASVVYTSGTTGQPKGVMLTHGNFLADVSDILLALPVTESDVVLSFLPLSHVFERTTGYYCVLAAGGSIYYAESMDTISANMLEARPTVVVSVPRLYEKMQKRILSSMSGLRGVLLKWAMELSRLKRDAGEHQTSLSGWNWIQHWVADRIVLQKVRKKTGGRLRFFVSGGAPLSKDIALFFERLGLLIIEGYGLTETSPVIACNRLNHYKFGSVGKMLTTQEVKISDDGELLVRGPIVMRGYLNLPDKTSEVLDAEGWFHTGDIATIDSDGFIFIVDRKKELIVLSNGKKVPPQLIETRLKTNPLVAQVMVCGDNRNYLTALIVPDFEFLVKRYPGLTSVDTPEMVAVFQDVISTQLIGLASFEQIKRFTLLPKEFTVDAGEVTPSLKLKRKVICEKFRSTIDQMYESNP